MKIVNILKNPIHSNAYNGKSRSCFTKHRNLKISIACIGINPIVALE